MSQVLGLDWYSIYKLNLNNLDLIKFNQIISNCNIGYGIDRVSLQYRKKILILFQNASKIMKMTVPEIQVENNQLFIERNNLAEMIYQKQTQVQGSFKEISNLKYILSQKQRTLTKLKQRLKKGYKKNQKIVYYCSYCERKDFYTVQQLKSHINDNHQQFGNVQKQRAGGNHVNQLKDLLMTMKDKQIQMMSMVLRASKEMQFQKLEQDYESQYKKAMRISSTKTQQSKDEPIQLKGQSKFLFFPKEEINRKSKYQQQNDGPRYTNNQNINELNKEFYQGNYYNIFNNIMQNVSEHIEVDKNMHMSRSNRTSSHDSKQYLGRPTKSQRIIQQSKISLVENNPKPLLEFKPNKYLQKESVFQAPSISDRLRDLNKQKQSQMNSIFSTKRKFYEDSGYVFNSGPLMDDKGGDSDYQDYFKKDNNQTIQIQDQQIKFQLKKHQAQSLNRQSFQFNKLLSPKQSNSFISRSQKQKSALIDLSDSFSKKDFQISKDDLTINLSDLKLSKLQRKKQEQKAFKSEVSNSMLQSKSKQNQNIIDKDTNAKNNNNFVEIHRNKPMNKQLDVLKDFQRKKIVPLIQQNYYKEQKTFFHKSFQGKEKINLLNEDQSNGFGRESNLGILNEFMKKQLKVYPNLTKQTDRLQFQNAKK